MANSFKHVSKALSLSIGLLLVAALFLMTGTAQAAGGNTPTQQDFDTGHATCSAYDLKANKLLPACGFKRATKIGSANTKCPSGTFADVGAETQQNMSTLERDIERLEQRHKDWFTPHPTFSQIMEKLQGREFFEESRAGDVQIQSWQNNTKEQQHIAMVQNRLLNK